MNEATKRHLENIQTADVIFMNAVGSALMAYRDKKAMVDRASKAYKNEQAFKDQHLPEAKQTALDAIKQAEKTFRRALQDNTAGLKAELRSALNAPIPAVFTDRLAFYRAANLTPTKSEVDALIQLAHKHPLALRGVAKLLDDQHAPIRLEYRTIEELEADLENLDDLSVMPLIHAPHEVHSELTEVMTGQPKPTKTSNGWQEITGIKWTGSIDLLVQSADVASRLRAIETAASAWSADVTYAVREREHVENIEKTKKATGDNGEEYTPDPEPASSVHVTESATDPEVMAAAKQFMKDSNANTSKILKEHYLK